MKRKRLLLAVGGIAALVGVTLGVLALLPARPGVTRENFDRIEIGMTRAEVEAILGPPTDFFTGWPFPEPNEPIWENDRADEGQIQFDEDSRVKAKDWHEMPDDRGVFERLMDLLPWRERPVRPRPRFTVVY
jgi:hypothetical protein